jgi:hypothetical protein
MLAESRAELQDVVEPYLWEHADEIQLEAKSHPVRSISTCQSSGRVAQEEFSSLKESRGLLVHKIRPRSVPQESNHGRNRIGPGTGGFVRVTGSM